MARKRRKTLNAVVRVATGRGCGKAQTDFFAGAGLGLGGAMTWRWDHPSVTQCFWTALGF